MFGLLILLITTLCFAFLSNFYLLVLIRCLQGVGSAFADTSAFGLIVDHYHDEDKRRRCLGIANACISFGSLIAPPFVGSLTNIGGQFLPFTAFAAMINRVNKKTNS